LYACMTPDYEAMEALMDKEGVLETGEEWFSFQDFVDTPGRWCIRRGRSAFRCLPYEATNVVMRNRVCRAPTPAEAANGYGTACTYWLAYAYRSPSSPDQLHKDRDFCVTVRLANSIPKVTYAADDSRCE